MILPTGPPVDMTGWTGGGGTLEGMGVGSDGVGGVGDVALGGVALGEGEYPLNAGTSSLFSTMMASSCTNKYM